MIDLANKCVLIRTHEEYENILKAAKKQGYRWYGGKEAYPYPFEEQQIPDILKFYGNKELTRNASLTLGYDLTLGYELVEASDVIEYEKKLKDAINLVRAFAKNPDRTALTDSFIESLNLLADTVESQMKEVKQMERLTERMENAPDGESNVWVKQHDYISAARKLCDYEDLEEQGLLMRLPCKVGDTVYRVNAGAKQPIIPMTVSEIHFLCYKNERAVRFDAIGKEDMGESCYRLEDIGRIVFLTRKEAEKKLEEMKNE